MSTETPSDEHGGASELPRNVDIFVQGWLGRFEQSGDSVLDAHSLSDVQEAVRYFIDVARGVARERARKSPLPQGVLERVARSLRAGLDVKAPSCEVSDSTRVLIGNVCARMLSFAAGESDESEGERPSAVLSRATATLQRAKSALGAKRGAARAAAELCEAAGAIWWDRGDTHVLEGAAASGIRLKKAARSVALSPTFWTESSNVVFLSPEHEDHRELLARAQAASGVVVRACAAGRSVGALSVFDGQFDEERVDLLSALTQQAAATAQALEYAADKAQLAEAQQRSISELGFALSSALSLEELLELVCRSAMDLTHADGCLVYLAEPQGELVLRTATEEVLEELEAPAEPLRSFGEQVRGQPLGRPLYRTGHGGKGVGAEILQAGYETVLGAALSIRGEPLGALVLLAHAPRAFRETEREMVVSFAAQSAVAVENLQLVEDMQRRLLEMADLTWVSTRITSTMEVERIAATVVDSVAKAIDIPRIALFLVAEDGSSLPLAGGALGFGEVSTEPLVGTQHIGHEALSMGVPQSITDAQGEGRAEDALVVWMGARSLLCLPLLAQQGLQGLLVTADTQPRDFPSHTIALLSAYANQTALALQSAMLYQDVVRHLGQLEHLFEVAQTLTSSLELTHTLDHVLTAAGELLDAPVGTLMLMDSDARELQIKAAMGIRPDHDFYRPLKLGEGLSGRAAQAGVPLVSADVRRDGRFAHRGVAREGGLQAAISAPLLARGRTVGVLNLYRRKSQAFDENDKRLVTALANSAAIAIENARLYEETQERAQFLTAMMAEINHRVRNTLQAVAGLLRMEMEAKPPRPLKEALARGVARLQSVAVVHDLLQTRDLSFVDIKNAAGRIAQLTSQTAVPGNEIETRVTGARVMLPSQQAANVALVLSELVDNSVRHGFAGSSEGRISIVLQELGGNSVVIEVKDNGVGLPEGFTLESQAGLGLKVVRGIVEDELGGCLEVESNKGTTIRAKFPKRR
ncbi:MAG: GAF domain-containing protein [Armatimonadetes bacterium]|nr:GAF domain-containing protein [Armatimonadota bacterium]